ncbi:MAG: helix-turn-helix transcriptional regulator [Selenomonas sp.]|uniref:helix-turn-helix transcriptional regulator n=1 Tax=Selenomonas sp. AE3005 TaxID=1485543 RepID=UPI0006894BEA|nr:helix-turn-helix transcriptional regulator [Selenomonas sp. AE3005]MBQ5502134.1 helix-turn-helix transcriptional regulator [Selenomonas sp.]
MIHIENKLQFLRELHELKQQDVADTLGVSRSTYANYESGRRAPDIDMLMRLADIYGISLDELTGHEVNQSQGIKLTSQALRLLKSFNQLPLNYQEWYISHMAVDAKGRQYSLDLTPSIVADKIDEKK